MLSVSGEFRFECRASREFENRVGDYLEPNPAPRRARAVWVSSCLFALDLVGLDQIPSLCGGGDVSDPARPEGRWEEGLLAREINLPER